jgi:hypothetical protein
MRLRRIALASLAAFTLSGVAVTATATPANAGPGISIPIVNAPNGVYWRETNPPSYDQPTAINGYGVYNGTVVEPECYVKAGTWPGSTSHLWYRATIVSGRGYGSGYVHDHMMGTPWNTPDRVIDGVPPCGDSPGGGSGGGTPSYPDGGSLYYSPYPGSANGWIDYHHWYGTRKAYAPSPATKTMNVEDWAPNCQTAGSAIPDLSGVAGGKRITTLAGWSLGRVGPMMALESGVSWVKDQVNFIILFDPGPFSDYKTGHCDQFYSNQGDYLARWLAENHNARFMVLAGYLTADYAHPVNGYAHASIQNYLFNAVRSYPVINGYNIRNQVVVCNYDTLQHEDVWMKFAGKMNDTNHTSCPGRPNAVWHP